MSLLDNLLAKRRELKPTSTLVTYLDGRKFEETTINTQSEVPRVEFGFIVDTKPDNVPAKITNHIYLGSQDCCESTVLAEYEIGCVLSVGIEAPTKYDNIVYKFVQCLDLPETNLDSVLRDSVDFINAALERQCNVLVHCNAGVSRSASIVIGYLILNNHYNYTDAYNLVKSVRNCVRPNDGFIKQLKQIDIHQNELH